MRLSQVLLAVAVFTLNADARFCHDDLTVKTNGGIIHGTVDKATSGVRQFLGIPYARPPVNDLRFAPPQPALPFGELNAKDFGPSCMQYTYTIPNINTHEVLEFNLGGLNGTPGHISEDCLTLSIWAPRGKTKKNLPVLIFFYGGGFTTGGTNVPYLLPGQWIQRTQGHIVVAFNHRDNIFGYPNAAGLPEHQQNVGLLDMRLAVEWVRDNIASFGGDPARIGLWGESSGGSAIAYYTYTYRADPIANSVILASGNEFIDILTRDPAHANFTFVASQLNCSHPNNPPAELACMRRADAHAITALLDRHTNTLQPAPLPLLTFSPIIDNHTVFPNYTALAHAGQVAPLPALIGSNAQDGVPFVPYHPTTGINTTLADEMTMTWFFCPSLQAARARIAATAAGLGPEKGGAVPPLVYRYVYAGNFSNVSPRGWMGAYHGAEMPLVFGTHGLFRGASTGLERRTAEVMQDVWVEFVATAGRGVVVGGWGDGAGADGVVDGGRVVEFGGEGGPARVVDMGALEERCRELGGGGQLHG